MARPKKAEAPTAEVVTTEKKQRVRRTKEEIEQAKIKEIDETIKKYTAKIKELEAEKAQLLDAGNKKKQEQLLKKAMAGGLSLEEMANKLGISLD